MTKKNPPSKLLLSKGFGVVRRRFLKAGAVIAMSGLLPASKAAVADDGNFPPHVPSWMKEQGAPILSPPYGQPSLFEKHVLRRMRAPTPTQTAASSMTPLQDLHGIISRTVSISSAIMPAYRRLIRISIG